jgi:hypothetical protein
MMREEGAAFIFTGEVVGQRPMSQQSWALDLIEKKAGLEGLLLRPLSALRMAPTIPEEKGWVDRSKLFGITGRSRKEQIRLAAALGIDEFPNPAGGCLLTEKFFCARLQDLLTNGVASLRNIDLLKFGRHFRLSENFFLVVGRNHPDNEAIKSLAQGDDYLLAPDAIPGPTGIGVGKPDEACLETAAGIIAYYTRPEADSVPLCLNHRGESRRLVVSPMEEAEMRSLMI